ncbi:MAG: SpoIIE family protein phosphatase [Pseudoflavonifractor sp.]
MLTKEKLKTRAAKAGEEMRQTGHLVLHAPTLVHGAECIIRFLLGAALSGAEIFGGYAPFGLALVGASGSGLDGFFALLGAAFGYLSFLGFVDGLRYVAAAILIFSVSFAFYDVRLFRGAWLMPLVAALLDGVTGIAYLSKRGWRGDAWVFCGGERLRVGAGVYFYRIALSPWKTEGETRPLTMQQVISLLVLGGTVLITLSKITLGGLLSLGCFAAAFAVLVAGYYCGAGTGAAVGVTAGLAMDIAAGGLPLYSMALGFGGLMTGLFRGQGKLFSALTFSLAGAVTLLLTWREAEPMRLLYECLAAGGLFFLLPEKLFRWARALTVTEEKRDSGEKARAYLKSRLDGAAGSFRSLYDSLRNSFSGPPPNDNDASTVFDRAADRVCRKCSQQNACWQRDYVSTFNALSDALPAMLERGRGEPEDFPPQFSGRCLRFPAFLSAANEALSALLYRRQYACRLQESRGAVCRQYGALADILGAAAAEFGAELAPDPVRERHLRQHLTALGLRGETAVFYDRLGHLRVEIQGVKLRELGGEGALKKLSQLLGMPLRLPAEPYPGGTLVLLQAEPLMAIAGVAAKKKDGQTVSGDNGAWFRLDDGSLYVLLCDGMGSGPEAGEDSALAVRLLEQFLRAGVTPEAALKTLNGALALRGEAKVGFTTIDLLRVDLFTGQGAVYKYGAAPTYLRKGDKVTRITGCALPAGLAMGEGAPDRTTFTLAPGDYVLLVSDGVTGSEGDPWVQAALGSYSGESPKDLAQALLEGSEGGDDRTALVLKIALRG